MLRLNPCILRRSRVPVYWNRCLSDSSKPLRVKALNVLLKNVDSNEPESETSSDPKKVAEGNEALNAKDAKSPSTMKVEPQSAEEALSDVAAAATMAATPKKEQQSPLISPSSFNLHEFAPKITVIGVGGAGGNALNNMIAKEALVGVDYLALNTDAQHLSTTLTDQRLQLGKELTRGLGCGANPDAGRMAAEESREAIEEALEDSHLVFITAGMGGGTGTGAAPVVANICHEKGILTVGVVTLPFVFEGTHRKRLALEGLERMQSSVDTLITIPNQNLFRLAGPRTSFVDAFQIADDVLLGGVKSITDLMTTPGLINLDFADVQAVMVGMGNALLGTGVASATAEEEEALEDPEQSRAVRAAEMALDNPLLGTDWDITTAKGMLVNITGGNDMTLYEVDKAAQRITDRIKDANANIIFGSAFDERLTGSLRVSVVATGIENHTKDQLYKY